MDSTFTNLKANTPLLNEITEKIIGSSFSVMNTLGSGFLEKVYENALTIELKQIGLKVIQQKPIEVQYKDHVVGEYMADLLVEDQIIVELKAVQSLQDIHFAQCLNYLKATGFPIGMLLNFGNPELQFRRVVPRKEWKKDTLAQ